MMDRIALQPFVEAHPPHPGNRPAPPDVVDRLRDHVPSALAELWRTHGFGLYGPKLIQLIDPGAWQATLDRWIVSPPGEATRMPIALTPFGTLLYYRRLSATDGDVAALDPHARSSEVLSFGLAAFFDALSDPQAIEALIPSEKLRAAGEMAGPLEPGEVYAVDQVLLPAQLLRITRNDALALHARLRDAIDLEAAPDAPPATSLAAALPPEHRAAFARTPPGAGVAGLYLSVYIDWRRLLALEPDGTFRLLFWYNHPKTGAAGEARFYTGPYRVSETPEGTRVSLDITLRDDSLGGDDRDAELLAMRSGDVRWLLRLRELETVADAIGGDGRAGPSECVFRSARPDAPLPESPFEGVAALPFEDLPPAVQALPRRARAGDDHGGRRARPG